MNRVRLMIHLLLLAAALIASAPSWAARAWLDRERIELGETVTLNVQGDSAAQAPDYSLLSNDFDLVGQSSQSQVSFVNGQRSSSTLWAVALSPKRDGVITIPAFDLGSETTEPVILTVTPPSVQADGQAGDDVFLEVDVTPQDPYVQQQVRFVVRLYYAVTLLEGQLDEPSADGAEFRRSGNDRNYQKTIADRRYNVVERRYLLLPEHSGDITIPGVRFRGRAVDPSRRGFGFGGGQTISAHSPAQNLTVRAQPAGTGQPWLPGEQLQWVDNRAKLPDQVEAGVPLTLDQRLGVQGLAASQLPELSLPEIDGAKIYPDQSTTREEDRDGQVVSTTARKFAIVATEPGSLLIPEQRLQWWNTVTDQAEEAVLPARFIQVIPAAGATAPPADEVTREPQPAADDAGEADAPGGTVDNRWRYAAIAFALLWIVTLLLFFASRRRRPKAASSIASDAPDSDRLATPSLRAALKSGELADIDQALRAAARQRGLQVTSLSALAAHLGDPLQRDALARLDAARFGATDVDDCRDLLRKAFANGLQLDASSARPKRNAEDLPPLYPR